MGFEATFVFHRRIDGGGYDTEKKEERTIKIGKPFDETPLEKLAAVITSEMARRDILVVDVRAVELVRKEVSFKECKDGKGITLKNRRFSFNESAESVSEEEQCVEGNSSCAQHVDKYPHEIVSVEDKKNGLEDLYGSPNKAVPVIKKTSAQPVNQKKVLYYVYFEPYFYEAEAKRRNLKFVENKKYPVHSIVQDHKGRLDNQKLIVTDDLGRMVEIDEKFFTSAGTGLVAEKESGFSRSSGNEVRRPKLAFEDESFIDVPTNNAYRNVAIQSGIPLDNRVIPEGMMAVPNIRPGRRTI